VKVVDLYNFNLEVSREDAVTINQVLERVKEQGRVWWAMEAKNGAGWYLQPEISSQADVNRMSSLSLSTITSSMQLKKLIRKGIPPSLRPRVWMAVSGATKKQSTVPESYYQDLTQAVKGRVTPATRQIDHVKSSFPHLSTFYSILCGTEDKMQGNITIDQFLNQIQKWVVLFLSHDLVINVLQRQNSLCCSCYVFPYTIQQMILKLPKKFSIW